MGLLISPAKVVLLAVHYTIHAEIDNLRQLAAQNSTTLRKHLLLRMLLTYLPETVRPSSYVDFVKQVANDEVQEITDFILDSAPVDSLTEEQASKRVRKLHLLELECQDAPEGSHDDFLTQFLFLRAHKMDEEVGMLNQLVDLLIPFIHRTPAICTWMASTVIPLSRRNFEYYTQYTTTYSLRQFQALPDHAAIEYLLSNTGLSEEGYAFIGRDLRGLVSPWLHNDTRWTFKREGSGDDPLRVSCDGWQQVQDWLLNQASSSWRVAVGAIEQWDGPKDVDLGDTIMEQLQDSQLHYLDHNYARAAMAVTFLIPEASLEALDGAYRIMNKTRHLLNQDALPPLQISLENLPIIPYFKAANSTGTKTVASYMRNDLLHQENPLTNPSEEATEFLRALILSAFVLTRLGISCSVRRAGDLTLLRDVREQKGELMKLVRLLLNHAPRNDDRYWVKARREILWLHDWGQVTYNHSENSTVGCFGMVPRQDIENELLKAMLSNMRYSLVKSIYEDADDTPLPDKTIQDAVYHAALDAFDNASNPNRTRGGLKKCNDILHALPNTVLKSLQTTKQIEALLSAAHALSSYRLVLKQGEPFIPVVLRVHSDPISIIDKVLEQNSGAYTRLQEFIEIGNNMVIASFLTPNKPNKPLPATDEQNAEMFVAEKRIISMCVSAALREDDFETSYSYVVSRLGGPEPTLQNDTWSWTAALKAGQYLRTPNTLQPTHLGTSSGNLEIRHLEQRLECLATALRVAPAARLQEILESFRQCEEVLDAAITEEAAKEAAWDAAGDLQGLPGSFDTPSADKAYPPRNITASATARQAEEVPMSLFDLSRATARVATKNLTTLSSLGKLAQGAVGGVTGEPNPGQSTDEPSEPRTRKRDQLREDATRTLVSGVGWLLGANVQRDAT